MADEKDKAVDEGDKHDDAGTPPAVPKKKARGFFARMFTGIFRHGDDFEKRLQYLSKEEVTVVNRINRRAFTRNLVAFSIFFEIIAIGYAIATTRTTDMDRRTRRTFQILPMFLLPALSAFTYSAFINYTDIITNDDILGDEIPPEQQEELRLFCCQTLNQRCKYVSSRFPGAHPVSLSRESLQLLRQRYYYATWKADGTRYMMLITKDGCYLIDRKFNFRRLQMRFPCKHTNGSARNGHHYTLLDGEMVIDTEPGSQKKQRRYLIYDMMAINNCSVVKLPFHERWKMVEEEVVQPRNEHRRSTNNPNYRYDLEPFTVRRKGFWLLHTVEKLLKEFIPKLPHGADGIIFQGWDNSYVQGADEGLLKWKYPAMNSIDFLFELGGDGGQQLFLNEKGQKKLMDGYRIRFKDSVDSFYSGKILECSWDSETREWVCMRTRTDKSAPNDINTHKRIMQSIKDNITEEVLLNEINKIIRLPIYVHKIQKDGKAAEKQLSSAR